MSDFVGYHGKAAAGFSGARCLDGGIQRQQVGLTGDLDNVIHHCEHFLAGGVDAVDIALEFEDFVFYCGGLLRHVLNDGYAALDVLVRLISLDDNLLCVIGNAFTGTGKFLGSVSGVFGAFGGRLNIRSDDVEFT